MFRLMLRRVVAITLAWIVVGGLVAIYDQLSVLVFLEYGASYDPLGALASNALGGLLGGVLGGTVIVFYLKRSASQKPFLVAIALHTVIASLLIVLVTFLVSVVFQAVALGLPVVAPEVLGGVATALAGPALLKVSLVWFVVVSITSLLLEVSDKYGPGVLGAFVRGRYHSPKIEQRCFMFLDMRSSTSVAEELGHERYFDLLRRCFRDMTEAIVDTRGEIYQYVGDEVVITWPLAKGVADGNCVRCFERIRDTLKERDDFYAERFGLLPRFKAGLHAGEVTTGEVGTLRKDIVFTGDVLNTAARIQERCNPLGRDLLVSGPLVAQLPERYRRQAVEVETVALRGRRAPISIHAFGT